MARLPSAPLVVVRKRGNIKRRTARNFALKLRRTIEQIGKNIKRAYVGVEVINWHSIWCAVREGAR